MRGADEEGTLRQLKAHRRELVDPKITEHRGRIVKTTGDGLLVEFFSVVDAVRCAVDIQRGLAERNAGVSADKRIEFEGSVRKSGNRVRITAQLIDAATGNHIWADRYDSELHDIFDLQDQVTTRVVGAIAPKLEQVEIQRAQRKPTESLDAYDHYLRGIANLHQSTKESINEALRLFRRAIELDAGFAAAYGMAAWCFVVRTANGWMGDRAQEIAEAARLARRAVDLGADDATALSGAGYALVYVAHDLDKGSAILDRALALNPNHALALINSGWTKSFLGEPDMATKHVTDAIRLSPLDPMSFRTRSAVALAHFVAGRYDEASSWAEKALQERADYLPALRELAAANALMGRDSEAQAAMAHLRKFAPAMRVFTVKDWIPFRRPDDLARLEDDVRRAGLPE